MGGLSIWHILLLLVVVLVVFGAGKLPNVMSDLGKGIKSFKSAMNGEDKADKNDPAKLPPSDHA